VTTRLRPVLSFGLVLLIALLVACQEDKTAQHQSSAATLTVWAHAGQALERATLEQQIARFNQTHPELQVKLTFIPERSYNAQVQAAAIAGDLPDVLEFDGPYLYNYVWQGHLIPLEGLLSAETQNDLLPSIRAQGTYHRHLYGVGMFDSGLALYIRPSLLRQAGISQWPRHPEQAWSVEEFEELLGQLARNDADGAVLDLKFNYPDEWFTYAFSPIVQSAGGDLINRNGYQTADGVLNGRKAVAAMRRLQDWIGNGFVDANVDDAAFTRGRVALSWVGHWEYPRYKAAWGDDLALVPLPDFGRGSRTGQGSWVWGVTRYCDQPRAAVEFLEYLLAPEQVLAMSDSNGAVPATRAATRRSALYREDGPLHLFVVQLTEGYAVPRPQTPGYPVISNAFRRAFADIRSNADVRAALDRAVAVIDQDIRDNRGYPAPAPP
jgi:multiple sugar transport system substrate-binding protein